MLVNNSIWAYRALTFVLVTEVRCVYTYQRTTRREGLQGGAESEEASVKSIGRVVNLGERDGVGIGEFELCTVLVDHRVILVEIAGMLRGGLLSGSPRLVRHDRDTVVSSNVGDDVLDAGYL